MTSNLERLLTCFEEEAKNFSGRFGLAAQRSDENEPILYRAGHIFPTASVIKLAVVVEYFGQAATGALSPDHRVVIRAENQVGGSGVLKDLQPGLRLALRDLATLAITVSDNTAANLLIEQVGGLARINACLPALGMAKTTMGRLFMADSPADNTGAPVDFLRLLLRLARGQVVDPTVSRQILELMGRQQYTTYIPRYLPYQPFAAAYGTSQTVAIANKVGMLRGTINDAALITTPSFTYALVIFTRDCQDNRPDPDNEGALLVARLSKRVYDYLISSSPLSTLPSPAS